ncbi:3-carboxy-cis,cis-muconate cycloisomerase [Phyllobacterium brassicacearum]|uniref:3-carboxy-cis,cis-muconate cycloisomerase n=1 Tax=Phyllobacterium brassicacearum TaxID=314235 RepID=A0A2P7BQN1_9HYPH|nr:3-carboxy-cis,cis-muconate cycloisomerase [Phyllobacterium brassicacearum]PSH68776.1 3-carboxy-cis,cis-muconate cycloisomerase [Phyllobacterium brassicacearum]TDQ33505.1 3-carboxy-cis,cis-muconate cycloisomerase [Phyllobacterium brassicacearum]
MSICPFDHPYLSGLIGDEEATRWFSVENDIAAMLAFESALAQAEAAEKVIDYAAAETITNACKTFVPDIAALKSAVAKDGVVVPELIRQLRGTVPAEYRTSLHLGATSQDVIDTSLMIRLKPVLVCLNEGLSDILSELDRLERAFGNNGLMGRTRMQAAVPITVRDRIEAWRGPLSRHRQRLDGLRQNFPVIQFGGPAGTLDKLGDKGSAVRERVAAILGLKGLPQWHNQRDMIVDFADLLSQVSGSLGKIGQDTSLLAQEGDEIALEGGGKSSAMPHKQNPVLAELLVSLARYNATQISGMHQALIHEQERSGAAWTLEWMILPSMVTTTVTALRSATALLGSIMSLGEGTNASGV